METKELIFWDWPASRQPLRSIAAAALIVLGVAICASVHWLLGVVGAMLFISSLGEVLLPSRYKLTSDGIFVLGLHIATQKRWSDIERFSRFHDGLILIGYRSTRFSFKRNKWPIRCRENQETVLDIINKQCLGHGK